MVPPSVSPPVKYTGFQLPQEHSRAAQEPAAQAQQPAEPAASSFKIIVLAKWRLYSQNAVLFQ